MFFTMSLRFHNYRLSSRVHVVPDAVGSGSPASGAAAGHWQKIAEPFVTNTLSRDSSLLLVTFPDPEPFFFFFFSFPLPVTQSVAHAVISTRLYCAMTEFRFRSDLLVSDLWLMIHHDPRA